MVTAPDGTPPVDNAALPVIPARRRARPMPGDRLRHALLNLSGYRAQIVSHRDKPWASITFAGSRHTLALLFAGEEAVAAGERFIAALPEHEFVLPGQIVADANVAEIDHRLVPDPRLVVRCEVLLLDDC